MLQHPIRGEIGFPDCVSIRFSYVQLPLGHFDPLRFGKSSVCAMRLSDCRRAIVHRLHFVHKATIIMDLQGPVPTAKPVVVGGVKSRA